MSCRGCGARSHEAAQYCSRKYRRKRKTGISHLSSLLWQEMENLIVCETCQKKKWEVEDYLLFKQILIVCCNIYTKKGRKVLLHHHLLHPRQLPLIRAAKRKERKLGTMERERTGKKENLYRELSIGVVRTHTYLIQEDAGWINPN